MIKLKTISSDLNETSKFASVLSINYLMYFSLKNEPNGYYYPKLSIMFITKELFYPAITWMIEFSFYLELFNFFSVYYYEIEAKSVRD